MKICIIGAGNMGGAIAKGLATGSTFAAHDITVTAHTQATLDKINLCCSDLNTSLDNAQAALGADIVVIAVKPWLVQGVIEQIKPSLDLDKQIIISVAAGISFESLEQMLGGTPALFRLIPNTAIAIKQSMTLIAATHASENQKAIVAQIFDELGSTVFIDEKLMASGTAMTSCGIAYVFEYMKAAIQAGIELGLYPKTARDMVSQTMKGAVALMEANGSMPDEEIYKVCTPGGITIKGLNEMTAQGFDNALIQGLKKAAGR